jgi:hypothetical protein
MPKLAAKVHNEHIPSTLHINERQHLRTCLNAMHQDSLLASSVNLVGSVSFLYCDTLSRSPMPI